MKFEEIVKRIELELASAKTIHPFFPKDLIHAVSIMNEEAGESIQAALNVVYENGSINNVVNELIQTAAMCFRCLENMENLKLY